MSDPFADLPKNHFGAILADPPWNSTVFSATGYDHRSPKPVNYKKPEPYYPLMDDDELFALPVMDVGALDSVLFLMDTLA